MTKSIDATNAFNPISPRQVGGSVSGRPATGNSPNGAAPVLEILAVVLASGVAFAVEDFVLGRGWVPFGLEIRGAFSVVVGACVAVALVVGRGGQLADLGFKRPRRWSLVPWQVAAILAVFVVAQNLVPTLVSLLFELPEPDLSRYASISGHRNL